MGQSVSVNRFRACISDVGVNPEPHNFRRSNGTGPDYRKPRVLLIWAFRKIYYFGCSAVFLSWALAVDFLDILVQYKCLRYCSVRSMPSGRNIEMERSENRM